MALTIEQGKRLYEYNLSDLGMSEGNTQVQNSYIFNKAMQMAKADNKPIRIETGKFLVSNISLLAGVSIYGRDRRNTILESKTVDPIFVYTDAEALTYIEASNPKLTPNPGGANISKSYSNQGVEFKNFQCSGDGVSTKAFDLGPMAYTLFSGIYCTGFTDVCFDLKGVLLCDFYDCQFTFSKNGVRGNISNNNVYWANLVTFTNCRFRFITNIALSWNKGASIQLKSCDLSAIGTKGNTATGVIKVTNMSQEMVTYGIKGVDVLIDKCWSEQLRGGFWLDISSSLGVSTIRETTITTAYGVGGNGVINDMVNGVVNDSAKVFIENSSMVGFTNTSALTKGTGQTRINGFYDLVAPINQGSGTTKFATYS